MARAGGTHSALKRRAGRVGFASLAAVTIGALSLGAPLRSAPAANPLVVWLVVKGTPADRHRAAWERALQEQLTNVPGIRRTTIEVTATHPRAQAERFARQTGARVVFWLAPPHGGRVMLLTRSADGPAGFHLSGRPSTDAHGRPSPGVVALIVRYAVAAAPPRPRLRRTPRPAPDRRAPHRPRTAAAPRTTTRPPAPSRSTGSAVSPVHLNLARDPAPATRLARTRRVRREPRLALEAGYAFHAFASGHEALSGAWLSVGYRPAGRWQIFLGYRVLQPLETTTDAGRTRWERHPVSLGGRFTLRWGGLELSAGAAFLVDWVTQRTSLTLDQATTEAPDGDLFLSLEPSVGFAWCYRGRYCARLRAGAEIGLLSRTYQLRAGLSAWPLLAPWPVRPHVTALFEVRIW